VEFLGDEELQERTAVQRIHAGDRSRGKCDG
jgi:hypothetical protein